MTTKSVAVSTTNIGEGQGLPVEIIGDSRYPAACGEFSDADFVDSCSADALALAFKAIGHPVRLQIMELLAEQASPVCACDIESRFTLSQPTISHHLRVLRKADLVESERRGTWIYYSAREKGVGPLCAFLKQLFHDSCASER